MKRLVVLIPNMRMGGAQRSLVYMLKELDKTKIEVTLILFDKEGELISEIPSEVNIIYFENYYNFLKNKYCDGTFKDILSAVRKLDLVHLFNRLYSTLRYKLAGNIHEEQKIWLAVKHLIKKVEMECDFCVSYMQGTATYYIVDKIKTNGKKIAMLNTDYIKAGYSSKYDLDYYKKLDIVFCLTDAHREKLVSIFNKYKEKIIIIEDVTSINYIENQAKMPISTIQDEGVAIIVSVGRLEVEIKGYDFVVEVAKRLHEEGYRFRWYILGDGSGRMWLQNKIKEYSLEDKLILLGNVVNPYPYIKCADFVVQASRFEGKGRLVVESRILKTPIICTEFALTFQEIQHDVNAYIAETNVDSLYSYVKRLIDFPEECNRLRTNIDSNVESGINKYNDLFGI